MGSIDAARPRVLVCQHGARRRYAVPRILEDAGMLAALYTDTSAHSLLGRCAGMSAVLPSSVNQRLLKRMVRGVPAGKIFSSDCLQYLKLKHTLMGIPHGTQRYHEQHQQLSRRMIRWGMQNADIVYTMFHENLDFVRWAKARGMKSVVDVFISPATDRIMAQEYSTFPAWGTYKSEENIELARQLWSQTADLADMLICPSEWVAKGVRECTPAAASKIKVVPYGCSLDYGSQVNQPVKGRVLFAGGNGLRKGLHYLGMAATSLKPKLPGLDVRIAGSFPREVINDTVCKDLNWLGKLTSEQMQDEFLSAECFVLPSLSEGFAGVVAEAIGAGCPVVTTEESGSSIVHRREGLIVKSRDPVALADAIHCIATEPGLRVELAEQCREISSFYTEKEWNTRLTKALCEV